MKLYRSLSRASAGPISSTLHALEAALDDSFHVWANVGFEGFEFDWLVFCEDGWFGAYEEKRFPVTVRETAPELRPWILEDGSEVENPLDQVAVVCEKFRAYLRREICPKFFPTAPNREVSVFRGVYCPQITENTLLIQPRFGVFPRDIETFVSMIVSFRPHFLLSQHARPDYRVEDMITALNDRLNAKGAVPPILAIGTSRPEQEDDVQAREGVATLGPAPGARPLMRDKRERVSSGSPYEPRFGFSRAVRVGDRIWVSGTAPIWPDGSCDPDPAMQTRRCIEIILAALRDAGAAAEHVVRTRTYVVDRADIDAVMRVHGEAFGVVRPASTVIIVSGFVDPRWKVELEAEAVVD